MTKDYKIKPLKGSQDYITWAIRVEAYLTKEKLINAIRVENNPKSEEALATIRLLLENEPLIQIQHINNAKEAWDTLKNLYNSSGFNSEYLIIKEFFNLSIYNFSTIESYLAKIKELKEELSIRDIKIPEKIVIA